MNVNNKLDNPPAFPSPYSEGDPIGNSGMTLRDYFAIHAPDIEIARMYAESSVSTTAQILRYRYADAMLAERSKQ